MRRTSISRARVASGSLIAVLSLLAAGSSAKADELSELRSDSQLLQQRLNEINRAQGARASAVAGVNAPDGVTGGTFPRSFLIPGTDTSVSVSGDVDGSVRYRATPNGR
jgi:hypothetical protein